MLQFTPNVKRKRKHSTVSTTPFPNCRQDNQPHIGIFTGISVEVFDKEGINAIYGCGCYGKGTKSRSAPQSLKKAKQQYDETGQSGPNEADESLSLDLEESFLLAYFIEVLQINNLDGNTMSWHEMLQACLKLKPKFIECFVAYLYLKSNNWVIKSGIKFGGDFLIYQGGPHLYHASFIVFISCVCSPLQMAAKDFKGLQRIAENSNKDVLLLEVISPSSCTEIKLLEDFSKWSLTETVIRRFNYTAYVQNTNSKR